MEPPQPSIAADSTCHARSEPMATARASLEDHIARPPKNDGLSVLIAIIIAQVDVTIEEVQIQETRERPRHQRHDTDSSGNLQGLLGAVFRLDRPTPQRTLKLGLPSEGLARLRSIGNRPRSGRRGGRPRRIGGGYARGRRCGELLRRGGGGDRLRDWHGDRTNPSAARELDHRGYGHHQLAEESPPARRARASHDSAPSKEEGKADGIEGGGARKDEGRTVMRMRWDVKAVRSPRREFGTPKNRQRNRTAKRQAFEHHDSAPLPFSASEEVFDPRLRS